MSLENKKALAMFARDGLTLVEAETAVLAATGMTVADMSERLQVSQTGVKWRLTQIYRKIGLSNGPTCTTAARIRLARKVWEAEAR